MIIAVALNWDHNYISKSQENNRICYWTLCILVGLNNLQLQHKMKKWIYEIMRVSTDLELEGVAIWTTAEVAVPDCAIVYVLLSEGGGGREASVIA